MIVELLIQLCEAHSTQGLMRQLDGCLSLSVSFDQRSAWCTQSDHYRLLPQIHRPLLSEHPPATMLSSEVLSAPACRENKTFVALIDFSKSKEMLLQSLNYLIIQLEDVK